MIRKFDDFKNKRNKENESLKTFSGKKGADKDEEFNDIDRDRQFPDPNGTEGMTSHKAEQANKQSNIRSTKTPIGGKNNQNLDHMDLTKVQSGDHSEDSEGNNGGPVMTDERVNFVGKVAKFPKGTKAVNALNFLENIKISKKDTWYCLVEKQDNELQMVKYNNRAGVNLVKFVNELKTFYLKKLTKDKAPQKVIEAFNRMEVSGDEDGNFSVIRNVPPIKIDNRSVISILQTDLIELLDEKLKK